MGEPELSRLDRDEILASLRRMRLLQSATPQIVPLTGGVSSLIVRVDDAGHRFCAKSALPKLNVSADWRVPVRRNRAEVDWMRTAAELVPGAVPTILGQDVEGNMFAMAWLDPDRYPVWKHKLLAGEISIETARQIGAAIGHIHSVTSEKPELAAQFDNGEDFEALRLDPYLRETAKRHDDLGKQLSAIAHRTARTRLALIHGDVSPKNILVGPDGPVLLDAECATWGDPAFDLSFCLNHLLLKSVHMPARAMVLLESLAALLEEYLSRVTWEPVAEFEARAAALLAALALARIDGKSPVEYLRSNEQEMVRDTSRALISRPPTRLIDVVTPFKEILA
ncbi:phosphotransferase [Rhizobium sp. P38BS-XIX]|uniref:phosphotransferase family protein n=1 Tax=Rhizobium sp. P38BS-XIX TaxID=2726740 RepID=UPI00145786FF|nr:aminoglycoside phosphotransferase family protein [Rhizobium sp. P38BS-XIX]NLR97365.1 phosphotransferase [Rhizobium sp. P38BS-XIX]